MRKGIREIVRIPDDALNVALVGDGASVTIITGSRAVDDDYLVCCAYQSNKRETKVDFLIEKRNRYCSVHYKGQVKQPKWLLLFGAGWSSWALFRPSLLLSSFLSTSAFIFRKASTNACPNQHIV